MHTFRPRRQIDPRHPPGEQNALSKDWIRVPLPVRWRDFDIRADQHGTRRQAVSKCRLFAPGTCADNGGRWACHIKKCSAKNCRNRCRDPHSPRACVLDQVLERRRPLSASRRHDLRKRGTMMMRDGAPGRTRTSTMLPPPDFESGASTNSATGASRRAGPRGGPGPGGADHSHGTPRVNGNRRPGPGGLAALPEPPQRL